MKFFSILLLKPVPEDIFGLWLVLEPSVFLWRLWGYWELPWMAAWSLQSLTSKPSSFSAQIQIGLSDALIKFNGPQHEDKTSQSPTPFPERLLTSAHCTANKSVAPAPVNQSFKLCFNYASIIQLVFKHVYYSNQQPLYCCCVNNCHLRKQ